MKYKNLSSLFYVLQLYQKGVGRTFTSQIHTMYVRPLHMYVRPPKHVSVIHKRHGSLISKLVFLEDWSIA